jgi:hypothetical protein
MSMQSPRGALLVGSVPLADSAAVFRASSELLGRHLKRIPDGETGERKQWVAWQYPLLKSLDFVEEVPTQVRATLDYLPPRGPWRVKAGVRQNDVAFPPLGYARVARDSYDVFSRLKAEGAIPAPVRFQVCLPSPLAPLMQLFMPDSIPVLEPAYSKRMLQELEEIVGAIPADQLAIQWDVASEFAVLEGVRRHWLPDPEPDLLARLVRIGNAVPAGVELGYHLCYGDSTTKHFKEPEDAGLLVRVSNGIAAGLRRSLQWIHLPVPIERTDEAYFAPLRELRLPAETELYLGLLHLDDADEGAARRIAAASKSVAQFGVATECGFGRRPPEIIPTMFKLHARTSAPA